MQKHTKTSHRSVSFLVVRMLVAVMLTVAAVEVVFAAGRWWYSFFQERANRRATIAFQLEEGKHYTIMTLGESTTFDRNGPESWTRVLERILNEQIPSARFTLINKGVPSINSTGILANIEKNLDTYHPDVVIVMMGINDEDALYEGYVPSDITAQDSPVVSFVKQRAAYKLVRHLVIALRSTLKESAGKAQTQKPVQRNEGPTAALQIGDIADAQEALRLAQDARVRTEDAAARQILQKALEEAPTNEELTFALANVYNDEGRLSEATALYKKLIANNSRHPDVYVELGFLYLLGNRLSDAGELFTKALGLDPGHYHAHNKLALVKSQLGDQAEAEELYKRALDLPRRDFSYSNSRRVYDPEKKRFDDVIAEDARRSKEALAHNYQKLRDIVLGRGIGFVAVQYPLMDVMVLKQMLKYDSRVVFVDSDGVFDKAIRRFGYDALFTDRFAGFFGHTTIKGDWILAKNIADTLANTLFAAQ